MVDAVLNAAGLADLALVCLSIWRTVHRRCGSSSRIAVWGVRTLAAACLAVARRLPRRAAVRLLALCVPLGLTGMLIWWLAGLAAGLVLLWLGSNATAGTAGTFRLVSGSELWAVAGLLAVLIMVAFVAYVHRLRAAYERRERVAVELAARLRHTSNVDEFIASWLRNASRDLVNASFHEWTTWLTDIQCSHVRFPVLIYARPAGRLSWPKAALVVLDTAALVDAVDPLWTPDAANALLRAGSSCLRRLTGQLGLVLPAAAVSLQGREHRAFDDTLRAIADTGRFELPDRRRTWATFQRLRTSYAPYAAAVDFALRHDLIRDAQEP